MIYIYEGHLRTEVDDGAMQVFDDNTGQRIKLWSPGQARALADDIRRLAVHLDEQAARGYRPSDG